MKRLLTVAAGIALLAFVLLLWETKRGNLGKSSVANAPSSAQSKIESQKSKIPAPIDATELAKDLNAPGGGIRADLRLVSTIIDTYRSNFLREGNPAGNNAEITAVLAGENKYRLILIPKGHPAINAAGELCDRWGTPFFFHAESGTQMEIRSAGPDRKLHTADDAVLSP